MALRTLPFWLVDVFAREPLSGNGLSIFLLDEDLPTNAMQRITQEMRQFETIFLRRIAKSSRFSARIFTMEEELPFAGHPIIGAAALLHSELYSTEDVAHLEFVIKDRSINAVSRRQGSSYVAEMDQGIASVEAPIPAAKNEAFLRALNLSITDLSSGLPLQVVSTGLPYLIVPIKSNLEHARIVDRDFEAMLEAVGAKFVYVFQTDRLEGRTWDNAGRIEDIATGSAAGPVAAYLVTHKQASSGDSLVLTQGQFLNRPSELHVSVQGCTELRVTIKGQVCFVGNGTLRLPNEKMQSYAAGPAPPI